MTEKHKEFGRNFFDVISEHPKITLIAFLGVIIAIIGIFCFIIYKGNSVKIAGIEVLPASRVQLDTIFTIERETLIVDKPIVTRYFEPIKNSLSTKVQNGDTIIEVKNQSANINTGTNNGIIGNDNTVNIDIKDVQRKLNPELKQELIQLINKAMSEKESIKDGCIIVSSLSGSEPFTLAEEILAFLKNENMNASGIGQYASRYPTVKGVEIGYKDSCVEIIVGFK